MKSKLRLSLVLLAGSLIWGAGQPSGRAQSVVSPPANPIHDVAPPQGYPAAVVYPGVLLPALKPSAPVPMSEARRFLLDAAEIIMD
jgi:hypothetical protein